MTDKIEFKILGTQSMTNNEFINDFLYNLPTTYHKRLKYFNNYIASIPRQIRLQVIYSYIVYQRLRWAFRRLFNFWLYRKLRRELPASAEDPITLEPITEQRIELVDFNNRRIFLFDSRTITRYLHTQLLQISMRNPQQTYEIKNPYTQRPFVFKDFCGLYMKLLKTTWAIEMFYECGFSAELWKIMTRKMCELKELRRGMVNKTDIFIDDFLSFIEIHMERLQIQHREAIHEIVEFGIKHQTFRQHEFIQKLIEIYRIYNEAQITGYYIDGLVINLVRDKLRKEKIREFLGYIEALNKDSSMEVFRSFF